MIIGSFSNGSTSFKVKTKEVSDYVSHDGDRNGFKGITADDRQYHVFTKIWKFTPIEDDSMKFDLDKALAGAPVKLRDGAKAYLLADARQLQVQGKVEYPIVALVTYDNGRMFTSNFTEEGHEYEDCDGNNIVSMWVEPTPVFNHWDAVDPKWKFIAADPDGTINLYRVAPHISLNRHNEREEWVYDSDSMYIAHKNVTGILSYEYTDWRTSLVERPD